MSSRAEKGRKAKLRTIARAAENKRAKATGERTPAAVNVAAKPPRERKGLEWLLQKKRITPRQFWAGTAYGNLYRAVASAGLEPLRSCLNMEPTGGDGVPGLSRAEYDLDAAQKLADCHLAMRGEENMIAVCAAICGRQLTPREITTEHVETVEIETTLRLALNLLAAHFDGQRRAA